MIPIADSVRSRSVPYVNVALILLNLLVFMYEVYLSGEPAAGYANALDRLFYEWGNVPKCTLDAMGFDVGLTVRENLLVCREQPNPLLTIFTAMFLHGSWLHIGGNMLFLWIFGDNIEDAMGHLRYLAFYLLAGAAAAMTHAAVSANDLIPAIGASGAIAGVMGAYLVLFPRATVAVIIGFIFIPIPLPAFVLIGFWFFTQLFTGVASLGGEAVGAGGGVAYFAHIGGFVAGAVLVNLFVLGRRAYLRSAYRPRDFW